MRVPAAGTQCPAQSEVQPIADRDCWESAATDGPRDIPQILSEVDGLLRVCSGPCRRATASILAATARARGGLLVTSAVVDSTCCTDDPIFAVSGLEKANRRSALSWLTPI